jgi:hypothetical protein
MKQSTKKVREWMRDWKDMRRHDDTPETYRYPYFITLEEDETYGMLFFTRENQIYETIIND